MPTCNPRSADHIGSTSVTALPPIGPGSQLSAEYFDPHLKNTPIFVMSSAKEWPRLLGD